MNEVKKGKGQRAKGVVATESDSRSSRAEKNRKITRPPAYPTIRLWVKRSVAIVLCLALLISSSSYALALWYQHSQKGKPYELGVTFIPTYAEYLGVEPEETLSAIISDLGVRQFRLVSYWDQIETSPGTYNFEQLDWQFRTIEKAGGYISLAIGLRQPRWPE